MKIGVIRVWWLGDSIVFSPFLKELRNLYPKDEITLFVQHNSSWEYFSRIKYVDKLEYIDRNSSFFTKILRIFKFFKKYDIIIDTINWIKISCLVANIFWKKTIGFKKNWKYNISIEEKEYNQDEFMPLQDLTILKKIKNIEKEKIKISLDFPIKHEDSNNLNIINSKYCVFHTWWSSQNTWYFSKNLSLSQIEEIIDYVIKWWYKCIIIWSKTDKEILDIRERNNLLKLTNLSIWELWALIERADLYVWTNSWPMWIAMALNKKAIVFSSATSKSWQPQKKYFPNVTNIVSSYNNCCMCWVRTCKYIKDLTKQWLCMKNIDINKIKDLIINK